MSFSDTGHVHGVWMRFYGLLGRAASSRVDATFNFKTAIASSCEEEETRRTEWINGDPSVRKEAVDAVGGVTTGKAYLIAAEPASPVLVIH